MTPPVQISIKSHNKISDLPQIISRSRSRPTYVVPKKDQIRQRKLSGQTYSKRALSPIINVREYLSKADEKIEDVLERIVQNVHDSAENAQVMVQKCVEKLRDTEIRIWKACHFDKLPTWMRDNEYLHFGHRPQLPSFAECFRSIFRIHSETGNIWTHLIGFVAFVIATIVFYVKPLCDNCHHDIQVKLKNIQIFIKVTENLKSIPNAVRNNAPFLMLLLF